jgi:uncharacterized protein (TIGR04255 family)
MLKTYKNPPLLEAVCEFRFAVEEDFSAEKIGAFYSEIQSVFPKQKKGKMNKLEFHIDIEKTPEENKKNISQDYYEFEQYFSDDEKYFVQLDGGRLSIHRIKPYTSWTVFLPLIQTVRNAYMTHFEPTEVARIGIRYVNEMILPSADFNFSDYFSLQASVPSLEVNGRQSIFLGSVYEQSEGRDAIKIQFADKQQNNPEIKAFVLDLDYFLAKPIIQLDGLDQWLNEAHTNLESVFEGMLTDRTKDSFEM